MESTLAMLYARDFHELGQILTDDLPTHLGVDAVSIAFETSQLPPDCGSVVKALPAGTVDVLLRPRVSAGPAARGQNLFDLGLLP